MMRNWMLQQHYRSVFFPWISIYFSSSKHPKLPWVNILEKVCKLESFYYLHSIKFIRFYLDVTSCDLRQFIQSEGIKCIFLWRIITSLDKSFCFMTRNNFVGLPVKRHFKSRMGKIHGSRNIRIGIHLLQNMFQIVSLA